MCGLCSVWVACLVADATVLPSVAVRDLHKTNQSSKKDRNFDGNRERDSETLKSSTLTNDHVDGELGADVL